ncbi:hypothetical protein B0H14DRAFT_2600873 [Mycena olivaceomarginata]|nr:hypothetical protein B0H14DRAFT_2600873 [Mycena olivaceomarginata]
MSRRLSRWETRRIPQAEASPRQMEGSFCSEIWLRAVVPYTSFSVVLLIRSRRQRHLDYNRPRSPIGISASTGRQIFWGRRDFKLSGIYCSTPHIPAPFGTPDSRGKPGGAAAASASTEPRFPSPVPSVSDPQTQIERKSGMGITIIHGLANARGGGMKKARNESGFHRPG